MLEAGGGGTAPHGVIALYEDDDTTFVKDCGNWAIVNGCMLVVSGELYDNGLAWGHSYHAILRGLKALTSNGRIFFFQSKEESIFNQSAAGESYCSYYYSNSSFSPISGVTVLSSYELIPTT